jgi:hypothetical protein
MNTSENSRVPSATYLHTSFVLLGLMQLFNIVLTSLLTLTIVLHRPFRTLSNLLTANSSAAIFSYSVLFIGQLLLAKDSKDSRKEPTCIILSYLTATSADAICYSYLVTAISQYFFNIRHRNRYLLTFRVHFSMIIASWLISCLLPLFLYVEGR